VYWTGIWKPPKGTIFPPWEMWRSYRGVLRSESEVDSWRIEGRVRDGRRGCRGIVLEVRGLDMVAGKSLRRIAAESWREHRGNARWAMIESLTLDAALRRFIMGQLVVWNLFCGCSC
jgi:hypothetical protein